jgi:hypothetical protein
MAPETNRTHTQERGWQFAPIPLLVLAGLVGACTTIAPYNQTAYEQSTALKAEALILMDKATEPYSLHKNEAQKVRLDMETAYEYAKGRPKNELSTKQWEIVRDPERHSLGGFLKRWENEGVLNEKFISEAKRLISDQLDQISGLESGKTKPH